MKTGKSRTIFVCQECGGQTPRWAGRCPDCGQWNSLKEENTVRSRGQRAVGDKESPMPINQVAVTKEIRFATGLTELDRVLGGGVVPGSIVLVGGDPGIGKTTLLLQTLHGLEQRNPPVLYVTGEESAQQIKMRGDRLGVLSSSLYILTATHARNGYLKQHTLAPQTNGYGVPDVTT